MQLTSNLKKLIERVTELAKQKRAGIEYSNIHAHEQAVNEVIGDIYEEVSKHDDQEG